MREPIPTSAEEAQTEAWLRDLVEAVRADPHALDPVIELAARQLYPVDNMTPP